MHMIIGYIGHAGCPDYVGQGVLIMWGRVS